MNAHECTHGEDHEKNSTHVHTRRHTHAGVHIQADMQIHMHTLAHAHRFYRVPTCGRNVLSMAPCHDTCRAHTQERKHKPTKVRVRVEAYD